MIGSWWSFLLDRQATAVIFSFSGAARVCSASWTECTTHLRRGNCRYSFVVRFFWHANGSDFLSGRAHSFCFPRPIRRPFSRAQATGTSCHDLHIWFSAETLCCQSSFSSLGLTFRRCQTSGWQQNCWSWSDANLTTCNLKLAEYFIRFTFDNILLHVMQAKKTNREVRHLALPVLFSQLELIYT